MDYAYRRVRLARHEGDGRGLLCVVQNGNGVLPFRVERVFWITDIPEGGTRGGHLHKTQWEALFAVSGSFDLLIESSGKLSRLRLSGADEGVLIPPGTWSRLENFAPGTVCLALCDGPYDAAGYEGR